MWRNLRRILTKRLQQTFWVYVTYNFFVEGISDFRLAGPAERCELMPITFTNYHRVGEFRDGSLASEYLDQLNRSEIGFFAELDGKMVGSIWATINSSGRPSVLRTYVRLMPNEALVHDIVTGEKSRGLGIAPFMLSRILVLLLSAYKLPTIIIDVNVSNTPSLRVMDKLGLRARQKVLCVSVFGKLKLQRVLREYAGTTDWELTRLVHSSKKQANGSLRKFSAEPESHRNA